MTMIQYGTGKEAEFTCPHCGGSEIVERTTELIECRVTAWCAEDDQPLQYEEDANGLPLRDTRETLATEYRCGDCCRPVEVTPNEDEE